MKRRLHQSSKFRGAANAELERVRWIEEESGFRSDEGGAGDGGNDGVFGGCVATFEDAANDAFLPPDFIGGEFSICGKAGELGAGTGAAGGAVVFAAGAEDEVSAVVGGIERRCEEFDVVDFGESGGMNGITNGEAGLSELGDVLARESEAVIGYQEKPVSAIGDVSSDAASLNVFGFAVGCDVLNADAAIGMECGGDAADEGFHTMRPGADSAEVGEGDDEADHAMAAHAEAADVVEKDDSGGTGGVCGLHEQCADDDFMAAWFADDGATVGFEVFGGDAAEYDTGGFAAGVGVDDGNAEHGEGYKFIV